MKLRRLRALSVCSLLALGAPTVASASDPVSPVALDDSARAFELQITLGEGLTSRELAVTQIFDRFQGVVVDEGARLVGGFPVRRALPVVDLGRGLARIDLSPVPAGQRLPDGLYSQFLEIEAQPFDAASEPFTTLHPIYFEVVGGVARRVDMGTYSDRVEPTRPALDQSRRPIQLHVGRFAATPTPPEGEGEELQVERGDAYAQPRDERNEN